MDYWVKLWPVLVTLVGLIGAAFTLKSEVDSIKENLGPPGSLPVIELRIEQLNERTKNLEKIRDEQRSDRDKMFELIRSGQDKVDSLYDLIKQRNKDEK